MGIIGRAHKPPAVVRLSEYASFQHGGGSSVGSLLLPLGLVYRAFTCCKSVCLCICLRHT